MLSVPLEIYLVFVAQAKSLEELRVLLFTWPTRKTSDVKRKAVQKAAER